LVSLSRTFRSDPSEEADEEADEEDGRLLSEEEGGRERGGREVVVEGEMLEVDEVIEGGEVVVVAPSSV
jgi:hypothetical protein